MGTKNAKTSGAGEIQVFELTMDNPEDQDELNRKLCKPAEAAKVEDAAQRESAADSSSGARH